MDFFKGISSLLYRGILFSKDYFQNLKESNLTSKKILLYVTVITFLAILIDFILKYFIGMQDMKAVFELLLNKEYKLAFSAFREVSLIPNIFLSISRAIFYPILFVGIVLPNFFFFYVLDRTLSFKNLLIMFSYIFVIFIISDFCVFIPVFGFLFAVMFLGYIIWIFYRLIPIFTELEPRFYHIIYFVISFILAFFIATGISTYLSFYVIADKVDEYNHSKIEAKTNEIIPKMPEGLEKLQEFDLILSNNSAQVIQMYSQSNISNDEYKIKYAASWTLNKKIKDQKKFDNSKVELIQLLNEYLKKYNEKVIFVESPIVPEQLVYIKSFENIDKYLVNNIKFAINNVEQSIQLKIDNIVKE
ncbi:MAG: Unknown protein [uncultured Campylobacterales bacterium]|uniref:Uncharacterized protein n=1 Tax=uncultured Campylobacterales bacterium TaxID=352960 RepID=A0A6S6SAV6_9BACT|nr:MAG: Unknown protein [uncultured Campylobacterales bacterium]